VAGETAQARRRGSAGSRLGRRRTLVGAGVLLALFIGAAIGVVALRKPAPAKVLCPPGAPCAPPTGKPLASLKVFTSPVGFRLEYDPSEFKVEGRSSDYIQLFRSTKSGGALLWVEGAPSSQLSPQAMIKRRIDDLGSRVVGSMVTDNLPSHRILGASVGWRSGIGANYAGTIDTPQGTADPVTVGSVAASNGRVTMAATYVTDVTDEMARPHVLVGLDNVVNSVRWLGDLGF
jgi:hypothetical protein